MAYENYQQLLVEKRGKIVIVTFNNPRKKNCLNIHSYKEVTRVLNEAHNDESVTIVVFTGVGDYFSAGNDLSQANSVTNLDEFLEDSNRTFKSFITSFIECSKVIISLVNGPAIGIGATIVGLSDVAWCLDQAYFLTPFTKLGLTPEGCSSYMLPLIVGRSKAAEMLMFNEPLSAKDAYHFGFVSRIFKMSELDTVVWPKITSYSTLPPNALLATKRLLRSHERKSLNSANELECEELGMRKQSDEFINAVIEFASRKSTKSKL